MAEFLLIDGYHRQDDPDVREFTERWMNHHQNGHGPANAAQFRRDFEERFGYRPEITGDVSRIQEVGTNSTAVFEISAGVIERMCEISSLPEEPTPNASGPQRHAEPQSAASR